MSYYYFVVSCILTYLPIIACLYFRYYHGVVQDTSTEEYYVVSFDDGTYCDNLPPTDIVVSYFLKIINNSLSENKENRNRAGGLDTWPQLFKGWITLSAG